LTMMSSNKEIISTFNPIKKTPLLFIGG